ncbi:hydantoinase B/oxoprolinase family protein [Pelagibacterium lacus]|uniref:Hydantoinase B/oxoprolinase family protein n=1 Tax=Pelagibacterium lacus TaxID=2282655 RepID=A0A369W354_9HYPH|nr:hydantoinase B/oxoprolinase family protein [Pelagibacterium lacus]RDE07702.1 hydantoinase B/oxoprolinase family protein [Pelagibacterium lacus]
MTSSTLDPISLEILWTRMISMVDEAATTLVRTSFSHIVRECHDYAVVLLDAEGRLLAQSTQSIPSFICTLPATARHILAKFPRQTMKDGDVFITNDPWMGTGHLPDINIIVPIFHKGELVAFSGTVAHSPDIGGRIRSPGIRELYEEGLRIPPLRLMHAGERDQAVFEILEANVRISKQVLGDLFAQLSANKMLEKRLRELLATVDVDLASFGYEIQSRAEQAMRADIAALPDGVHSYKMEVDGFGDPVVVNCRVEISGDTITVDYTGSSEQLARAINVVPTYTFAYTCYALKCILSPSVPNNEGSFRPITVKAPEGSILNPRFPAPVGARAMTGHLLPPAVFGALSATIPDRVQAPPGSPLWSCHLTGTNHGEPFACLFFLNGGQGASATADGYPAISFPSNLGNTPIEVLETQAPVRVLRREIRRGTGGAGASRGGDGQVLELQILADAPVTVSFMANRLAMPAEGLDGGEPGAPGQVLLNGEVFDPREISLIQPGDCLTLATPGGGGFGAC